MAAGTELVGGMHAGESRRVGRMSGDAVELHECEVTH